MHTQPLPIRQADAVITITLFLEDDKPACTVNVTGDLSRDRAMSCAIKALNESLARINRNGYHHPKH